jgi:hypothetical protein
MNLDDEEPLLLVPRPTCIYKLNRNIKINIRSPQNKLKPLQTKAPFYTKIRQTGQQVIIEQEAQAIKGKACTTDHRRKKKRKESVAAFKVSVVSKESSEEAESS